MIKEFLLCYKKAFFDTINQDGIEHAGYLSFLSMLAIFPFFIFLTAALSFLGSFFLNSSEGASLLNFLQELLSSNNFTQALTPRITEITGNPPDSFLGLAFFSILWTASSLLEGLRTILNKAYRVSNPPSYLWRRLLSMMQFLFISSLFLFLVFFIKFLPLASKALLQLIVRGNYPLTKDLLSWMIIFDSYLGTLLILLATFLLLSYIYYLIPNKEQKFSHTFFGTLNTILCWWIMSKAFKYYLAFFQQINLVYGSIAGIIIALLYFYICSIVFIYGAELNYWFSLILVEKSKKNDQNHFT